MTTPNGENTHDDAACVRLFTETLERLNEININQMQSILDIAIAGADAANSVNPANTGGEAFIEKVTALVEDLQAKAGGDMGTGGRPAVEHGSGKSGTFCETVERDVNIAIENSLANQQQLYVIGASVLSEAAGLVMTGGGPGKE